MARIEVEAYTKCNKNDSTAHLSGVLSPKPFGGTAQARVNIPIRSEEVLALTESAAMIEI